MLDIELRINEVAKLLGISTEAIRFYESKGIVTPKRNVENQYRYYSFQDVYRLFACRYWQNYGFSVAEITSLVGSVPLDRLSALLKTKEQGILKEISELNFIIERMHKLVYDHRRIISESSSFSISQRPHWLACWLLENDKLNMNHTNTPFYSNVTQKPYMFEMAMFIPKETYNTSNIPHTSKFGFTIETSKAEYLGLKIDEYIHDINPVSCVHTIIDSDPTNPDSYKNIDKWMANHKFRLNGDIICISLGTLLSEGRARYEAWLPIAADYSSDT